MPRVAHDSYLYLYLSLYATTTQFRLSAPAMVVIDANVASELMGRAPDPAVMTWFITS